jgi:hypothetical protein
MEEDIEEDFTMEACRATDQWNKQVSDQRVILPHTRLRAVFNDLSSTHSSPTEVSLRFDYIKRDLTTLLPSVSRHSVSRVELNVQLSLPKSSPHLGLSEPRQKRKETLQQCPAQANLKLSHSKRST